MKRKKYNTPKITINKVYTKNGDSGQTNIIGGHKISKANIRIKSFGEIDELNASIAMCCVFIKREFVGTLVSRIMIVDVLKKIQHQLFNLGNMIATLSEDIKGNSPAITNDDVKFVETNIDDYNSNLPTLKSFVLPGGSEINAMLHLSRTICRRCERTVVELNKNEKCNKIIIIYLNRLSDLLFVLSRYINHSMKKDEFLWDPNYND